MTRIAIAVLGSLVAAGCAADPAEPLSISERTDAVVAGAFGPLHFAFSHELAKHEAVLSDAKGQTLEDVFWLDGGIDGETFVLASLFNGRVWAAQVADGSNPENERASNELAARPEMQLVAPMLDSLVEAGIVETSRPNDAASSPFAVDLYLPGEMPSWPTIYIVAPAEQQHALHHGA